MPKRVKQKILANIILWLLWVVLGTIGVLPLFFSGSYIGQSHSIFRPLAALLDTILYIFATFVIVTVGFAIADQILHKK